MIFSDLSRVGIIEVGCNDTIIVEFGVVTILA